MCSLILSQCADLRIGWHDRIRELNNSTSKKVLGLLKTIYWRFWKVVVERVTIIKFRVNSTCGNDTGSFEVKDGGRYSKVHEYE